VRVWNDAATLNRVASLGYGLAALLVAYGLLWRVAQSEVFAVREVRLLGEVAHVTREQVEAVVSGELHGNFFTVDLLAARSAFEKLPWVQRVDVRRRWPDRLEITVQEHRAVARWGDEALLNDLGDVFEGASNLRLPVMSGPEGSSREVLAQYTTLQRILMPLGRSIGEIRLSDRRAWQLRLDDRTVVELGREGAPDRLARLVSVYERSVAALPGAAGYIDLRYVNGFAVRVNGLKWSDKRA
jgi:cell division protein FtsQ